MAVDLAQARSPSRFSHPVIWTLSVLLLALLAWSFLGEFDVVTTARGRVISDGQIKTVQSPVAGTVRQFKVREGDAVRRGDVLIELDATLIQAELRAIEAKMAKVTAELVGLEAEKSGKTPRFGLAERDGDTELIQARIEAFRAREAIQRQRLGEYRAAYESRREAFAGGQAALQALQVRLNIAREKAELARPYVGVAIPRFQFLQWEDDVAVLERDIAAQQQSTRRLIKEVEEARQRMLQVASGLKSDLNLEIIEKRSSLKQFQFELVKLQKYADDSYLRAPQDGVVQRITVSTLGATVSPNDTLLYLVPADTPMVLEVLIPNKEIGYIRIGQDVDIKFDAFPFQRHGRMVGRLAWISPDAELITSSNAALLTPAGILRAVNGDSPQYFFRARVIPLAKSNIGVRLSPGLTAQVDIFTDKRRIIDFFLFPFEQSVEEAVRVR